MMLFPTTVFAQYGKESGYWEFVENQHTPALVQIRVLTIGGMAAGTGSVIWKSDTEFVGPPEKPLYKAYILTAEHVLKGAIAISVEFQSLDVYTTSALNITNGSEHLKDKVNIIFFLQRFATGYNICHLLFDIGNLVVKNVNNFQNLRLQ